MVLRTFTEEIDNITTKITKEDKDNTDELILIVPFSTEINISDEVELYDASSTLVFSGIVQNVKIAGQKEVQVYDYGSELLYRTVNHIFNNMKPEEIIEYVIVNFTTLTYVSTITTTNSITTYVSNKKRAWDIVTEMSELMLSNFRVDKNKNFQLEREGENNSSKSIISDTGNGNAVLESAWEVDKNNLVNSVSVDGDDRQVFDVDPEFFSGNSSDTEFELTEIPLSVQVEHPLGTIKKGYTEGQSSGDYQINRENKKIIFDSPPTTGTDNIKVSYTSSIPVAIRRRDSASISLYGQHDKTYKKRYIKNRDEAREYANFIISRFAVPILTANWTITDNTNVTDFEAFVPNETINVTDNIRNVTGSFIIRKVERVVPGQLKVLVGHPVEDFINWSKETQQKILQLEEKDDNSTILNEDEFLSSTANIRFDFTSISVERRRFFSDTFYLSEDPFDSRNQMVEAGTGPVMREVGYTSDDVVTQYLITEDGDNIITEDGDFLVLEVENVSTFELVTEGGDNIITEDGDKLLIEVQTT